MRRLAAEGCSHFQGYFYGRPAPAGERLKQVITQEQ
jgi:EAL domain-containing protein (putative c-di-GMP-specific phosphodiesterase class I)